MAYYAKIDENNIVLEVLPLDDNDELDENGNESESVGQAYLEENNNWPAHLWIKTSYNTHGGEYFSEPNVLGDQSKAFRGNYAGIGDTWDSTNQIFIAPQPYPSWVINTSTALWESPVGAEPALTADQQSQNDAGTHNWHYQWNEDNRTWDLLNNIGEI